jgi:hypothetical protein
MAGLKVAADSRRVLWLLVPAEADVGQILAALQVVSVLEAELDSVVGQSAAGLVVSTPCACLS